MHFVGGKAPFQLAHELAKALRALAYRGSKRAIEFAVKKELPVLGIEAHRIGRQHIDGEIGCEPRNVFAVGLRKMAGGVGFYEVSTHTLAVQFPRRRQTPSGGEKGYLPRPWQPESMKARRVLALSRAGRRPTTGSTSRCSQRMDRRRSHS